MSANTHEETPAQQTDVVVIGAGISGLVAAAKLHENGNSYVVLEARDRVGGKTISKRISPGESCSEGGAGWINKTTQPRIYQLIQKFGLETIDQYLKGSEVLGILSGEVCSTPANTGFAQVVDKDGSFMKIAQETEEQAAKVDIYNIKTGNADFVDLPLSQWLKEHGLQQGTDAWAYYGYLVRALLGVEPDEVSTLYWFDYIQSGKGIASLSGDGPEGAQATRNRHGNQTISIKLAEGLAPGSVHLNSPVRSIEQHGDGNCTITTYGDRKFQAKKVIVSVPTPLYRSIQFSPALPADKAEYANSTFLGDYSKFTLIYAEPWWRSLGLCGGFSDLNGPISFGRDTSSEQDNQYSITCFSIGEHSRKWSKLSTTQRRESILDCLEHLAGEKGAKHVRTYLDARETIWRSEIWSLGGPCPVPGPGTWQRLGDSLRTPFENLHFVGTETAFEWKGYMEGALTSGERGASEVIASLA